MAKKVFDVVAKLQREGQDKARWLNCGAVFEGDKGLSLKLESIPAGPEWKGWFSLFEPKDDGDRKPSKPAARKSEPDDDIPW